MSSSDHDSDEGGRLWGDLARLIVPVVILIVLAAVWRFTPLGDIAPQVRDVLAHLQDSPAAPIIVVGVFLLGGLVVAPVSLLTLASVVTFGPIRGTLYALAGSLASAAVVFLIGHAVGREPLDRVLGDRARRVADRLGRHGVLAVAIIRNIPIAPYSVVNLVAGASPVRLRDFMLGTLIGFLPAMIGLAVVGESLGEFIRHPDTGSLLVLAGLVIVLAVIATLAGRWLLKRRPS